MNAEVLDLSHHIVPPVHYNVTVSAESASSRPPLNLSAMRSEVSDVAEPPHDPGSAEVLNIAEEAVGLGVVSEGNVSLPPIGESGSGQTLSKEVPAVQDASVEQSGVRDPLAEERSAWDRPAPVQPAAVHALLDRLGHPPQANLDMPVSGFTSAPVVELVATNEVDVPNTAPDAPETAKDTTASELDALIATPDVAEITEEMPTVARRILPEVEEVTYSWSTTDWPLCPIACDAVESVQTRTVTCMGSDGNEAAVEVCTETKPEEANTCPAIICDRGEGWVLTLERNFELDAINSDSDMDAEDLRLYTFRAQQQNLVDAKRAAVRSKLAAIRGERASGIDESLASGVATNEQLEETFNTIADVEEEKRSTVRAALGRLSALSVFL
jgi:hypothetical protein